MSTGFYKPTGKYGLLNQLQSIIDLYEQDRQEYWSETAGEKNYQLGLSMYEQVEKFTEAVLEHASELVETGQLGADLKALDQDVKESSKQWQDFQREFNRILKSDQPIEEIRKQCSNLIRQMPPEFPDEDENWLLRMIAEKVCATLAWESVERVEDGTKRIIQLYTLVLKASPSKEAQSFLSRLSRCFVWGFDPECIILCRSVIDTAFREVVDDKMCRKYVKLPADYEFSLSHRIKSAFEEDLIDKRARDAAYRVKNRGDKAVHYQPDAAKDVFEVIRDTLLVLQRIAAKNERNF